jgi:hypothetical protein
LTSAVLVDRKVASGISLTKELREEEITLFSSHNFSVRIEYENEDD